MAPDKPTVRAGRLSGGRGLATVRSTYGAEWNRVLGGAALMLGLLLLLSDLPVAVLAPIGGALFLACGVYCAFRLGLSTSAAAVAVGFVLMVPLMGLDAMTLMAYKILVGAGLGMLGIYRLT